MKAVCAMRGIPVACLSMLFAVGAGVGKAAWADDHVVSVKGRATGKTGKPVSAADELEGKASGHSKAQEKSARKQKIQLPPKRAVPKPGPEAVLLAAQATVGQIPVRSWKRLRDRQIVKQDQDFSCGAASLATLLNQFYGQNTTEEAILKAMAKEDGMASFEDMARVMPGFGFRAQGFAASWEQLTRLKIPVVVYVKHRKDDHFSVLRGIDANTVWLADPSLGNRTYSREQFLAMWQTREDKKAPALAGKFLAVLPLSADAPSGVAAASVQVPGQEIRLASDYFSKTPRRQSGIAVEQLSIRPRL